jgi:predicted regulator of Ras-like GTPase activity (Roadblock/LC7/MglB family)
MSETLHHSPSAQDLTWILDEFKKETPSIHTAMVVSTDGISTYANTGVSVANTERLAAISSGFHSLASGMGSHFDGGVVKQVVAELDKLMFFVAAAGRNTLLAVLANPDADAGLVGYQMTLLARRVGDYFATASRVVRTADDSAG